MKNTSLITAILLGAAYLMPTSVIAADYTIDTTHSFVEFKIQHLGYSWLYGRFNKLDGTMKYDAENPENSAINITIDTGSIDSNHAERDKHLRGDDFLSVSKFPQATFKSSSYKGDANKGILTGVLSLHGVEKTIEIPVEKIGEGPDPWGGERAGFSGTYTLTRADFGMDYELGPASTKVILTLGIEGIKK